MVNFEIKFKFMILLINLTTLITLIYLDKLIISFLYKGLEEVFCYVEF